ncbi:hypothetical protein NBRC116600_30370 [Thalassotalea sp. SU-HH00458]
MLLSMIKYLYRVLSTLIVFIPITLNVMYPSSIINSLLYIPVLSLSLALLFIYFEKQITQYYWSIKKQSFTNIERSNEKALSEKFFLCEICKVNNLLK